MITVTPTAAEQMMASARQSNAEGMPLRIAVQRQPDGSLHYGMGFDEGNRDEDLKFTSEGVEIVVSPASLELLAGTVIDYVELEPGEYNFVFMNPNDPAYRPPNNE